MLTLIVALTLGGLASACKPATSQLPSTSPSQPATPPRHSPASRSQPPPPPPLPLPIPFPDSVVFERAVAGADAVPRIPIAGARIVVIPHHWPVGHLALAALRDAVPPPGGWQRAIVLGPDHPNRGAAFATTSARGWRGASGSVAPDVDGVAALIASGAAVRDDGLVAQEHGVAGVLPAVRWAIPAARVLPVAVRGDAPAGEAERLAGALAPLIERDTLVVLSVDFAHGVLPAEAEQRGAESIAALAALDGARLLGWSDEHLDARGAVRTAMALARRLGATRWVLRERTDGSRLPRYEGGPVTSYVVGYYVGP